MTVYTDNLIPAMTSATDPSGVVTSSGEYGGATPPWTAFNHADAYPYWIAPPGTTGWLQYQFPSAHVITRYAITSPDSQNGVPKTWEFKGSNDGSTWDTLDTQTNITDWAAENLVRKIFDFSNTVAYAYYRLDIGASNDAGYVSVGELEMMETVRWFRRRGRNGQHDVFYRMKG